MVSIHAPVWGATNRAFSFARRKPCFNPRARAGRDPRLRLVHGPDRAVSIHAPVRGATGRYWTVAPATLFQSTRPCGARRADGVEARRDTGVSIHAPVRGATGSPERWRRPSGVSIHAPVRGATRPPSWTCWALAFQSTRPCGARLGPWLHLQQIIRFQSTRPCGARLNFDAFLAARHAVSIHAPVRGATVHLHSVQAQIFGFNPRARAGRDARFAATRRARFRFNPRARAGRDISKPVMTARQLVFQSTRPCGARLPSARPCPTRSRFNPRARAARPPTYNLLISMKKTFYFSETCLI